ncbi:MAG: tRNA (adenosine(37)-N6)-dimethylallyltransferase MiaA [Coriobacteriales bacterium]|jgi:tRNA dimethylallyltransferase|nr:tRNA (adenosine(37)-N6)-dimethylallyltransferase MiaA [Coriobacteriales bacterium]
MVPARHVVIAVVGSTATGKSAFSEALAHELNGEIVSADSMQVYKGMDIGTAKVPPGKRCIAYHCLDLVSPLEEFNAFAYQQAARSAIENILACGKQPIVCGGTGLYVRAALEDFVGAKQSDEAEAQRREHLNNEALEIGPEAFYAKLVALDPKSAALIHPNNVRRVVRAFEWLEEGGSYAAQAAGFDAYNTVYPTVFFGLDLPREELYERINVRVDQMMAEGLLDEVRALQDAGAFAAGTAAQAIGYKELREVLAGRKSLESAVTQIKQATRRYAKRQQTWFRRDKRIHWLDARLSLEKLIEETISSIDKKQ